MSPRALRLSPWLAIPLLVAALYWIIDLGVLRAGIPAPLDDTWEDGIIARLLWSGQWLRSHMLYPPLWGMRDADTLSIPVLVHGPLLPFLLAPPVRWGGPLVLDHVAWIGALFAWLTAWQVHRLASRTYGDAVGAAAALLFTLSPVVLEAVHHSLSVVAGALLLVTTFDLLSRDRPRMVLAGLCAGLGYLVRPETLLAVPLLLLLPAKPEPGDRRRFLLVFLACGSWWWWHHWEALRQPLFNLSSYTLIGYWGDRPEASVMRDFALTPERWPEVLRAQAPGLWRKWVAFFPHAAKHALEIPAAPTGWLALVGLTWALRNPRTRRSAACALMLGAIPMASMTLAAYQRLYLVPVAPLWAIAAALGARTLFERLPAWARRPRAWLGALALASLPATLVALRSEHDQARVLERWLAVDRAGLAERAASPANAGRPMFSDTPDFVAWTTGRPTLWVSREEFHRLYPGFGGATEPADASASPSAARAEASAASPVPSLPPTPRPEDLWFHVDPRNPAANLGGPVPYATR
jgi:hypothetical protein